MDSQGTSLKSRNALFQLRIQSRNTGCNSVLKFNVSYKKEGEREQFIFCSLFFYLEQQPPVGHVLLIHEFCTSHTTRHHSRQDSSGRVISLSQRHLPDSRKHSQQTYIHAPCGIRTHNLIRRMAADLRLRPRGHCLLLGLRKVSLCIDLIQYI